jgi:hypothetical protein
MHDEGVFGQTKTHSTVDVHDMFKPLSEEKIIAGIKFHQRHKWKMGIPLLLLSIIGFVFTLWYDQSMRHMIQPILTLSETPDRLETTHNVDVERKTLYYSGYRMGFLVGTLTFSAVMLWIGGLAILVGGRQAKMLLTYYEDAHRKDE